MRSRIWFFLGGFLCTLAGVMAAFLIVSGALPLKRDLFGKLHLFPHAARHGAMSGKAVDLEQVRRLKDNGDLAGAECACKELIDKGSDDTSLFIMLGEIYTGKKEYKKAGGCFSEAIGRDPSNTWALRAAANLFMEKKDYRQADAYFTKAVELSRQNSNNSDLAYSFFGLGQICVQNGNYREAAERFKAAAELIPDNRYFNEAMQRAQENLRQGNR